MNVMLLIWGGLGCWWVAETLQHEISNVLATVFVVLIMLFSIASIIAAAAAIGTTLQ